MTTTKIFGTALAVAFAAAGAVTSAQAGACPPDQVLTTVDLTGWRGMGNFMLRLRRLTIAADGVVPTHAHDDRPSIVYIETGELIEHSAFCAVPIVHKQGEWAAESGPGHIHWWENKTGQPVIVLSTDVVPFGKELEKNM